MEECITLKITLLENDVKNTIFLIEKKTLKIYILINKLIYCHLQNLILSVISSIGRAQMFWEFDVVGSSPTLCNSLVTKNKISS